MGIFVKYYTISNSQNYFFTQLFLKNQQKALLLGKFLQCSNQELMLYPTPSISSYSIFFLKIPLLYLKFRLTKLNINILIQNHTCTLGNSDVLDTKDTEHDKFLNKDHPAQICPWLLNKPQLSPLFLLYVTYKIVIAAFHISFIFVFQIQSHSFLCVFPFSHSQLSRVPRYHDGEPSVWSRVQFSGGEQTFCLSIRSLFSQ